MRLFVALWPPDYVVELLRRLDRPEVPGLRWTTPDQWHVTLRFLGEAEPDEVLPPLRSQVAAFGAREVALGPATRRLGRSILVAPVEGVDDLGRALAPEASFTGHLTLARSRRGAVPLDLTGRAVAATWRATSVSLVRSTTAPTGAVYADVATIPLQGEAGRRSLSDPGRPAPPG